MWVFKQQRDFVPTVIGYPILSFGMASLVAAGASANGLIGRRRVPGAGLIASMAYSLYLTPQTGLPPDRRAFWRVARGTARVGLRRRRRFALFAVGGLLYVTFERPALILRDRVLKRGVAAAPKVVALEA